MAASTPPTPTTPTPSNPAAASGSIGGDYVAGDRIINQTASGDIIARDKIVNNIQQLYARALSAAEAAEQERAFERQRLAQGVGEMVQRLQARAAAAGDGAGEGAGGQPYKGLLEYRLADTEIFFGRARAVEELLECLEQAPLTVLHSESGAGKSSLLHAGLAPRLIAAGHLPLYLRPYRAEPGYAIKRAFLADPSQAPELATAPLREFLRQVGGVLGPAATLYLCLDQFEEFFTQLGDPECDDFVRELAECLDDASLNVRWVLALRTEYFGRLANFRPQVRDPFSNDLRLERLTRAEAEEVIVQPALRRGVSFEAGLVPTLLDDLGQKAIAPPQLQLVCAALFAELAPGETVLSRALYEREGGVAGILRGHLERVLSRDLPPEQRTAARRLLESLISSEQQRLVRPRDELAAELGKRGVTPETLGVVLDQLVDSRLIKVNETDVGLAYELAHDYLLGEIKLDPEVQARKAAQELLEQELRAYRRYATLLSPDRLKVIEAYRSELSVTPEAEQLLAGSQAAAQAEERAEQERQQKDIAEARQLASETEARRQAEADRAQEAERSAAKLQGRNRAISVIGVLALVAAIVALWFAQQSAQDAGRAAESAGLAQAAAATANSANTQSAENLMTAQAASTEAVAAATHSAASEAQALAQQAEAQHQTRLALSRELAHRAAGLLPHQPDLSTLLAAEALRTTYAVEGSFVGEALAVLGQILGLPPQEQQLAGPQSELSAAAFDPSGALLATGGRDGVIIVWTTRFGSAVAELHGQTGPVRTLVFNADGARLLSAGGDDTARLWSADGTLIKTLEGHTDEVVSADFSSDGGEIVTASWDGTARVWDSEGTLLLTLPGDGQALTMARFVPKSLRIVTADENGNVNMWSAETGQSLGKLAGSAEPANAVRDIVFGTSGVFVTIGDDFSARLWQPDGTASVMLNGPQGAITSASFAPALQLVAVSSADGSVWVYQFSGTVVQRIAAFSGLAYSVRYSPDGTRLLVTGCDADSLGSVVCNQASALIYDARGQLLATLRQPAWTTFADFSPAGDRLFTAGCATSAASGQESSDCALGGAWLWGLDSFRLAPAPAGRVRNLQFNPAGDELLAIVNDQAVLFTAADASRLGTVGPPQARAASFSPDGKLMLTVTNGQVQLWDAARHLAATLNQADQPFDSAGFSPGGQWVVLQLAGKIYQLWPTPGHQPAGPPGPQYAQTVFSGDGRRLLTVDFNDAGQVWQSDGSVVTQPVALVGLQAPLATAGFSRDGTRLVTLSEDGVAQLWDGVSGHLFATLGDAQSPLDEAWIDPSGTRLVAAAKAPGVAQLLDGAGQFVADLEPLTGASWDRFSPSGDRLLSWRCQGNLRSSGCLKLLDASTGAEIAILDAPGKTMAGAQFSADGAWIFTPYQSGAVGVWDGAGHNFATLPGANIGSQLPSVTVAVNNSGTRLAMGGGDSLLQLFQLYPDGAALLAEAARRAGRTLSEQECAQYLHTACP